MAEKNKYGQYFTIGEIANFMVSLIKHGTDSSVLEPSCGKGVFLKYLLDNKYQNLSAYEIDPSLGNEYDFVQYKSFLSVPTEEKYDVVIGNPPYIRWKNIEPELKEELSSNPLWNQYFNSLCDYLFIFILKSIEHLNEGGELIFICTEYWLNTTHSVSLRNYMCEHGYFSEIYHFKEAPLFEKVTASFIIFRYVKSSTKRDKINLYRYTKEKGAPSFEELVSLSCFSHELIPHFCKDSRWILATKETQETLAEFENACVSKSSTSNDRELYRIGDYCDIGNGMVSGLDAAFQINDIDVLSPTEKEALIKVYKAKDLNSYFNTGETYYIFIQKKLTEQEFEANYSHFYQHFKPYVDKLNGRYCYNKIIPYWEFVFPRNQRLFERQEARIFIPCKERISNKDFFRFCYASEGIYPTQDVTAIFRKPNCQESIEYILAYLNNERVFKWLSLNGIVKGAIVEFSEAPIASIPYRPINWNNIDEVEIHNAISKEVRQFLLDKNDIHRKEINNLFNTLFNGKS